MAEAQAPSLGEFFKSKGKKKIKATNLNKETAAAKPEDKKVKKATEDDAWEEEQVVAQTMKVEVVGKLMREEEKKDDEDTTAPAWGAPKKEGGSRADLSDKKYPSLAKSVASINIDDGSDNKVNIATSKNVFAALEGDDEEDERGGKRPKAINSSMVTKKKGEFEKVALQREVDKYAKTKKKAKNVEGSDEEEEEEEDEEAEEEAAEVIEEEEKTREKKEKKKEAKQEVEDDEAEEEEEVEEDLRMQPDLLAAKEKYKGRKKRPATDLPREEMREQKENRPANQQSGGKKKKFVAEEETDKKIAYADW